jgi:hypothetical protein
MSLGFGVIAQLMAGKATTRWRWLIAAAGYLRRHSADLVRAGAQSGQPTSGAL